MNPFNWSDNAWDAVSKFGTAGLLVGVIALFAWRSFDLLDAYLQRLADMQQRQVELWERVAENQQAHFQYMRELESAENVRIKELLNYLRETRDVKN